MSDIQQQTSDTAAARLAFVRMTPVHIEALKELWPLLQDELPGILDTFYDHLSQYPELAHLLGDAAKVERLKAAQSKHWEMMFTGGFGQEYFDRATAIGKAHQRIGLEPRWYVAAYALVQNLLLTTIRNKAPKAKETVMRQACCKAVFLDMELAISVYIQAGEEALDRELGTIASTLDAEVRTSVDDLARYSSDIGGSSTDISEASERISRASTNVASGAEEASTSVESIAAASEELATTVREVERQMAETSNAVAQVAEEAGKIGEVVHSLDEEAQKIGSVVDLIREVADQTNLLALNATIEAARAGEAGKGFAVVASEVKALAAQTGKATQEIADQVARVQERTGGAVDGIGRINSVVSRLQEIAEQVDSAVTEQGKATDEISGNVQNTATGARNVSGNISEIAHEMSALGEMAERLQRVSSGLNQATDSLKGNVADIIHRLQHRRRDASAQSVSDVPDQPQMAVAADD